MASSDRHIRLLAHNVRSLWNVGSLFRTCDAFNVEMLLLSGYTGIPPRREITKTALGAEEWVAWEKVTDPVSIVQRLNAEGWSIVALEQTTRSVPLMEYRPPDFVCIVVGHEVDGVARELLPLCETALEIPMLGNKESLNVAVAAGIALYHLRYSVRTT